ncbi:MAG: hypothetical protein LBB94_06615 [Clostridiales bacterium]|jgi:hypothetical protein|nr:hypothetical protein [Clostridiales bacterium]
MITPALVLGCVKQTPNDTAGTPLSSSFKERLAALAPYTPSETLERYYSESVMEFIPSDGYGQVYPYPGLFDSRYPEHCVYGFVDQDGRVICEPVYFNVQLWKFGEQPVYFLSGMRRVGVGYTFDDFNGAGSLINMVVSADGSFYGDTDQAAEVFGQPESLSPENGDDGEPMSSINIEGIDASDFDLLKWIGDYYLAANGRSGGLIAPDGTWFVKVPLEDINGLVSD